MSPEENRALAYRFFAEIVGGGRLDRIDTIFAPALTLNGQPATPETVRQVVANVRTAFPDVVATVEAQVAAGDQVATLRTLRGTHRGAFRSPLGVIPPTGRAVAWQQCSIVRFAGGKIVEDRVVADTLGLPLGLGA
jgi:predicted ester cyclase